MKGSDLIGPEDQPGSGIGPTGGGFEDGDGSQPLTNRDNFVFWSNTLVIGFAGHTQSAGKSGAIQHQRTGPVWDVDPGAGVYEIGVQLRRSVYMVTLFPEDIGNDDAGYTTVCGDGLIGTEGSNGRVGGALEFLVKAVNEGSVTQVVLFGYSHGGGCVELLADFMAQLQAAGSITVAGRQFICPEMRNVRLLWAGYIDGVNVVYQNNDATGALQPEKRFPTGAEAFFSAFQAPTKPLEPWGEFVNQNMPNGFPRGGDDVEIDTEHDARWANHRLNHNEIDNDPLVQQLLLDHLKLHVPVAT